MTHRKDPERRQRQGAPVKPDLVLVGPGEAEILFDPPGPLSNWLKVTRDAWGVFWTDAVLRQLVVEADLPQVLRLFDMRDMRERCAREARKNMTTLGSTGQVVVNPLAKEVHAYDTAIAALEKVLGLGSLNRMSLGIATGEAARSLDDLNARIAANDEPALEVVDPRLVIEVDTA